nr:MAG TPA: hypothetical protein [Caudoviricetes sp.]
MHNPTSILFLYTIILSCDQVSNKWYKCNYLYFFQLFLAFFDYFWLYLAILDTNKTTPP